MRRLDQGPARPLSGWCSVVHISASVVGLLPRPMRLLSHAAGWSVNACQAGTLLSGVVHVSCQFPSLSHRCLHHAFLTQCAWYTCQCLLDVCRHLWLLAASTVWQRCNAFACMHACVHVHLFDHWSAACQWLFTRSTCCCFTTTRVCWVETCQGPRHAATAFTRLGRLGSGFTSGPQPCHAPPPTALHGSSPRACTWTPAPLVAFCTWQCYCTARVRYYVPHAAVHSSAFLSDQHVLRCVFTFCVCNLSLFVHNHRTCRSGPCLPCLLLSTVSMQPGFPFAARQTHRPRSLSLTCLQGSLLPC